MKSNVLLGDQISMVVCACMYRQRHARGTSMERIDAQFFSQYMQACVMDSSRDFYLPSLGHESHESLGRKVRGFANLLKSERQISGLPMSVGLFVVG